MRLFWIAWEGPKNHHKCPRFLERQREIKHIQRGVGDVKIEADWNYVAIGHGLPAATRRWKREDSFLP